MSQRPQVSDEEIKGFMDFQDVLTQRDKQIRIIERTSYVKKIVVYSIAIVAVAVFWFIQTKEEPVIKQPQVQTKSHEVVVPDTKQEQAASVNEKTVESTPSVSSAKPSEKVKKDKIEPEQVSPPPAVEEQKPAEESSYVQAEPARGYQDLYDYFAKNLIYPKEMMKDSIQGVSTVTFVINKDGHPGKIEVTNSLGAAFDKEIARLIENMPDWKPALLNGKPVPSRISLPVTFQLQKVSSKQ